MVQLFPRKCDLSWFVVCIHFAPKQIYTTICLRVSSKVPTKELYLFETFAFYKDLIISSYNLILYHYIDTE